MTAENLTFGIELECFIPASKIQSAGIRVGGYHRGEQLPSPMPRGWNAQSDGSLSTSTAGMIPVEIVSPVLSGQAGAASVRMVVEWLQSMESQVNRTCGFHVHVGAAHLTPKMLARLVCLVSRYEEALFAATGTPDRRHSHYCRSIKEEVYRRYADRPERTNLQRFQGLRYRVLNLDRLTRTQQQTAEFRVFQGTLNVKKIMAYVQLCLGLVERAGEDFVTLKMLDGPAPADTTPADWLHELLHFLGWGYRGRKSYGVIAPLMTADCIRELERLVSKYAEAITPPAATFEPATVPAGRPSIMEQLNREVAEAAAAAPPARRARRVPTVQRAAVQPASDIPPPRPVHVQPVNPLPADFATDGRPPASALPANPEAVTAAALSIPESEREANRQAIREHLADRAAEGERPRRPRTSRRAAFLVADDPPNLPDPPADSGNSENLPF